MRDRQSSEHGEPAEAGSLIKPTGHHGRGRPPGEFSGDNAKRGRNETALIWICVILMVLLSLIAGYLLWAKTNLHSPS